MGAEDFEHGGFEGGGRQVEAFGWGEGFSHGLCFAGGFFAAAEGGVEAHYSGEAAGRGVVVVAGGGEEGVGGGGGGELGSVEGFEGGEAGVWIVRSRGG